MFCRSTVPGKANLHIVARSSKQFTEMDITTENGSADSVTELDISLSPRVASLQPSKTMVVADKAVSMAESGIPVVRLAAGEPDFNTPEAICKVFSDTFGLLYLK